MGAEQAAAGKTLGMSADQTLDFIKGRNDRLREAQRAQADLVNYRTRASQELEETRRNLKITIFFGPLLSAIASDFQSPC